MYLKPVQGPVEDLDTFDKSGMWINEAPDGFKVIDVTKGGPAEAAGLQKDDIITAIDGSSARRFKLPELRERWRTENSGTRVKLTVKRGAERKKMVVTLRDLI
jgi:C-terminal processing protease CtpA/Prc